MKRFATPFILFFGTWFSSFGQGTFQNVTGGSINLSKNGGSVLELAPKPPTTEGSYYYHDQVQVGTIYLKDGRKLENLPIKYDLSKKWLEVGQGEEAKIATDAIVQHFEWLNVANGRKQSFINATEFTFNNQQMNGFLEVLADGKIMLLASKQLEFKPTNYNALMDVGDKNNKIMKKEVLYLAKDKQLQEISTKNKEILAFFGDKSTAIETYTDKNDLKLRKAEDLKKVVAYYNKL